MHLYVQIKVKLMRIKTIQTGTLPKFIRIKMFNILNYAFTTLLLIKNLQKKSSHSQFVKWNHVNYNIFLQDNPLRIFNSSRQLIIV